MGLAVSASAVGTESTCGVNSTVSREAYEQVRRQRFDAFSMSDGYEGLRVWDEKDAPWSGKKCK